VGETLVFPPGPPEEEILWGGWKTLLNVWEKVGEKDVALPCNTPAAATKWHAGGKRWTPPLGDPLFSADQALCGPPVPKISGKKYGENSWPQGIKNFGEKAPSFGKNPPGGDPEDPPGFGEPAPFGRNFPPLFPNEFPWVSWRFRLCPGKCFNPNSPGRGPKWPLGLCVKFWNLGARVLPSNKRGS